MTTDNVQLSVLLIGKSQLVLDESVAGLHDLGYKALATNDFTDISGRFDVKRGRPGRLRRTSAPDRKAEPREEIGAVNPGVTVVQGLAASQASSSTRRRARSRPTTQTPAEHRTTRPTTARSG
jgi:hypothetical protein